MGVTIMKRQGGMLKIFGLYGPNGTCDETFLINYIGIHIKRNPAYFGRVLELKETMPLHLQPGEAIAR